MLIDANTKLNSLFKFHKDALDKIVGLNVKFEKLKNPILRKIMAPRTTISMAAKIGGCHTDDFFEALRPLGFTVSKQAVESPLSGTTYLGSVPRVSASNIIDVRPILSAGKDPLKGIIEKTSMLNKGESLCIINSFEPSPLITLLKKKGFDAMCFQKGDHEYHTYFTRSSDTEPTVEAVMVNNDWEETSRRFHEHFRYLDVRKMTAPLPMVTILEELQSLPEDYALYVYHQRVPVYLLPEINDRGFEYRIRELREDEVHLIIFRK